MNGDFFLLLGGLSRFGHYADCLVMFFVGLERMNEGRTEDRGRRDTSCFLTDGEQG